MPFWRVLQHRAVCRMSPPGQVFFRSLAGYAFARLRFRGRDTLFVLRPSTLMVPLTVTVIPVHSRADRGVGGYAVGDDRAGIVR